MKVAEQQELALTDEPDDLLERINQMVSLHAKNTLKRLASYYGVTQRAVLESAITNAERALFDTLPCEHQNGYYDMNITLRSNTKQGTSNNESLTDRTKERLTLLSPRRYAPMGGSSTVV